jgi:hypothetical protein
MKEKIWKLLELLNEYEDVFSWYASYTIRGKKSEREIKSNYMFDEDQNIIQLYIISKSYWFIKWLVENEKIEENSDLITLASELWCAFSSDVLLMYLAIQDEPIRFLCEIIK